MNIFFDMSFTQASKHVVTNGGGESAIELLDKLLEEDISIDICFDETRSISDNILKKYNNNKLNILKYRNIKDIEELINHKRYDKVVFPVCPPNYGDIKLKKETNLISIIHDLSTIYADNVSNKERYIGKGILSKFKILIKETILKNYMRKKHMKEHFQIFHMTNNQQIITVSNYSKYAMCYYFGKELEDKITVCYSSNIDNKIDVELTKKFLTENQLSVNKFFLLVSGSRWHKNNFFAIQTLDRLYSKGLLDCDFKVVVTGVDNLHKKYYKGKVKNIGQFLFMEYVDAKILEGLYKNMFALIYPSLYEGFGFPAIYAMKYGKNILATSSTSLPEICQEIAYYFDPVKEESLAVAIMEVISDPLPSDRIIERYNEIKRSQSMAIKKVVEIVLK